MSFVKSAVANLDDKNIFAHFFTIKETPGHPSAKEQEEMAYSLVQSIDENISW